MTVEAVEGLNDQQLTHLPAKTDNGTQGGLRSSREREMCSSQLEKTPRADVTPNACLIAY